MKFFFSLPGEVFRIKKKKKVFTKNLPGASNTLDMTLNILNNVNISRERKVINEGINQT
jgi:hypothetical protein